jgi:hypothetical protein
MKRLIGLVMCGALGTVTGAVGADLPSFERGGKLFASTALGTSGKSCATCHPDGTRLGGVSALSDEELTDTINGCIAGPLKGVRLDPESADMKSLLLYLRSFSGTGR